jgi:hypothetical protein
MKSVLIVIIAMYLVFAITDVICCPILYQKVFYRVCKDSFNDDQDASVVSRKLAREFTFRFAFVPLANIAIFIFSFLDSNVLSELEMYTYDLFMKDEDAKYALAEELKEIKKD